MTPRLTAYAGVQLRDFLLGRLPLLLFVTVLATWSLFRVTGVTLAAFDPSAGIGGRGQSQLAFESALGVYALLGAVFAVQGLIARDRWRGYDRVIFSRPLTPVRYYLQGFVAAGVAVVALGVVAAGLFSVAVHPVSVPGVAAYVALAWLVVGAFAFAVSTLTAYYLPLVVGLVAAAALRDRFADALRASGSTNPVVEAAQYLLPPTGVLVELRESFARGHVIGPDVLAWPLAFGALWLAVSIFMLHRRPFRP